jgi:hypothetical protein
VREGVELVNEALGTNPAQAVPPNVELAGIIRDDDGVRQKAMGFDAAPQGAHEASPVAIAATPSSPSARPAQSSASHSGTTSDQGSNCQTTQSIPVTVTTCRLRECKNPRDRLSRNNKTLRIAILTGQISAEKSTLAKNFRATPLQAALLVIQITKRMKVNITDEPSGEFFMR